MKAVAFFLDSGAVRSAQTSLELQGIPSTIISVPLKESEPSGGSGYRLLVDERFEMQAEQVLQDRQAAFMQQVQGLLKEREGKASAEAQAPAVRPLPGNRFWYWFAIGVALVIMLLGAGH